MLAWEARLAAFIRAGNRHACSPASQPARSSRGAPRGLGSACGPTGVPRGAWMQVQEEHVQEFFAALPHDKELQLPQLGGKQAKL